MKSDWRGEARGIAPKRMMSARGPPVWISSIPQQARPNVMYQNEVLRARLMRLSSWLVWSSVISPPTSPCIFAAIIRDLLTRAAEPWRTLELFLNVDRSGPRNLDWMDPIGPH